MHAAGKLGQGGTRALQLPPDVRHRRSAVGEQVGDMGEPALGALAQLPLQASALGIAGLHDPSPGGLDLGHPRPDLRLEPGVGDCDPGGGRHRVDQDRVAQHGGVVDEGADLAVTLVEIGDRPGAPGGGQGHRPTRLVDVAGRAEKPVGDDQGGIPDVTSQLGLHGSPLLGLAQVDHQTGDGGLSPAPPQQVGEQTDRH